MEKDIDQMFEEDNEIFNWPEDDVIREFDEVEADVFTFYFNRGSDGHIVEYTVKLPYDATYTKVADYFAKFISDVYEYQIEVEALGSLKKQQKQQDERCSGCTNPSCLAKKGC